MSKRIVEIERCLQCPFCNTNHVAAGESLTGYQFKKIVHNCAQTGHILPSLVNQGFGHPVPIPAWCPLPGDGSAS